MVGAGRLVVAKIGTSSLTDQSGVIQPAAIEKLCGEVAGLRAGGDRVVVVSSGAIAAGLPYSVCTSLDPPTPPYCRRSPRSARPTWSATTTGPSRRTDWSAGQVLLAPLDFVNRQQYLHARQTLRVLLDLGVVPVVNENDAIADDEIRFGDNDRLAALVSHLLGADLLVLLTDIAGPAERQPADRPGRLADRGDRGGRPRAGGPGRRGRVGARERRDGLEAGGGQDGGLVGRADGDRRREPARRCWPTPWSGLPGVGTVVVPRPQRLPARKLWIAFAVGSSGTVVVDGGARTALLERGVSLLPAGVVGVKGSFEADSAVELAGPDGRVFAKGLTKHPSSVVKELAGRRTSELPPDVIHEVVHRDDLVLLP